jgi:hypothetical protein
MVASLENTNVVPCDIIKNADLIYGSLTLARLSLRADVGLLHKNDPRHFLNCGALKQFFT